MARINQFSKEGKMDNLRRIADNPRFSEAQKKLSKFQDEIASHRKTIGELNAEFWQSQQKKQPSEDVIAAADQLFEPDGSTADMSDRGAKIRDLERRIEILQKASFKQGDLVEQIRGELSAEAARLVQTRHRAALARILETARALVAASAAERSIRGELIGAGFIILEQITPAPRLAAPLILGEENWRDSAISCFARQLRDLGIPS
jgi:hypothetical protein